MADGDQPVPVFRTIGLGKTYRQGEVDVIALRDVNLQVDPGEFLVMLGPSGSGKSTLLNLLGGLDVHSQGELWFRQTRLDGADQATLTAFRRAHVGFVFQFYNLMPSLTVRENVALVTDLCEAPMDIGQALDRVGLLPRQDHFPSQLSGGEQQRVAIARAIVKQPQVLLCDEPTGALDDATGKRVLAVLDEVNRDLKTTVVIITHNVAVGGMADRVLRLADGRVQGEERHAQRVRPADIHW